MSGVFALLFASVFIPVFIAKCVYGTRLNDLGKPSRAEHSLRLSCSPFRDRSSPFPLLINGDLELQLGALRVA